MFVFNTNLIFIKKNNIEIKDKVLVQMTEDFKNEISELKKGMIL